MTVTEQLFDFDVRLTDPETSVIASRQAHTHSINDRELALTVLRSAGEKGLTDFQLAEKTGKAQTSIGKRRDDLVNLGYVEATGERRPSPSGSPSMVWRITELGLAS